VDIFEDQHLNVDQSGAGDRARLIANLQIWAGSADGVTIFQRSSLEVSPKEISDVVGLCRMVSIDGGHTEECTLSDLRLAEAIMHEHGIAVIDDCFNEDWPDVVTGLARYCFDDATRLRPFAISPNKVFLARPDHHARIMEGLMPLHGRNRRRRNRMFGSDVAIFRAEDSMAPGPKTTEEIVRHVLGHPGKILNYVVAHPDKVLKHVVARLAVKARNLTRSVGGARRSSASWRWWRRSSASSSSSTSSG